MLTEQEAHGFIAFLIERARESPTGRLEFRGRMGEVAGYLVPVETHARPADMPRHLRPKQKLSKRARDAAKREKLNAGRVASPVG